MVEVDTIFVCIISYPKWISCVRYGLLAQYILNTLCLEGYVVARDILRAITLIFNLWLRAKCMMNLVELVVSTPLTLLLKPDGGIRPIDVSSI